LAFLSLQAILETQEMFCGVRAAHEMTKKTSRSKEQFYSARLFIGTVHLYNTLLRS